jgi:hypothetical protein
MAKTNKYYRQTMKQKTLSKWLITAVIAAVNIALWAIPDNVAYLVAQQRDVLLSRYSVAHMTWILLLLPISVLALYLIWANEKNKKKRRFQVIALSLSLIVSLCVVDLALRLVLPRRYVRQEGLHHRQPNTVEKGVNRDVPPTAFSYPHAPKGYPPIDFTLTVDHKGFRNQNDLNQYEILALGDSFTEGSGVSDDQAWPVLLAQKSGKSVYNLSVSGGHPGTYLESFKQFGLDLHPKVVFCTLYEGNDFRDDNFTENQASRFHDMQLFFKRSPIRRYCEDAMIRYLGPLGSGRVKTLGEEGGPLYPLSWLPLAIPEGPEAKFYTFKIKDLIQHYVPKSEFENSYGCQQSLLALRDIKTICRKNNIRLIVVYAPDKPHVVLPLAQNTIYADLLHKFFALKADDLPDPEQLKDTLLARMEETEAIFRNFCEKESIEFLSLTKSLQQEILTGRQAYFTYDQHWTPLGHQIAAETVWHFLQNR